MLNCLIQRASYSGHQNLQQFSNCRNKLLNSATTATAVDTPDTIVLRDGFRQFLLQNMISIDGTTSKPKQIVATKSVC